MKRSVLWAKIGQFSAIAAVLGLVIFGGMMTRLWTFANTARNTTVANESRALAALSDTATPGSINAFKLALAAWPRSASDPRPRLRRTVNALSRAMSGPFVLLPDIRHEGPVWGAVFDKAEARILSWSQDRTVRLWDVARLGPGNLVEAACRLLPDKDVSTLRRDFGIDVTDPICSRAGKDAPAPDFRELVD